MDADFPPLGSAKAPFACAAFRTGSWRIVRLSGSTRYCYYSSATSQRTQYFDRTVQDPVLPPLWSTLATSKYTRNPRYRQNRSEISEAESDDYKPPPVPAPVASEPPSTEQVLQAEPEPEEPTNQSASVNQQEQQSEEIGDVPHTVVTSPSANVKEEAQGRTADSATITAKAAVGQRLDGLNSEDDNDVVEAATPGENLIVRLPPDDTKERVATGAFNADVAAFSPLSGTEQGPLQDSATGNAPKVANAAEHLLMRKTRGRPLGSRAGFQIYTDPPPPHVLSSASVPGTVVEPSLAENGHVSATQATLPHPMSSTALHLPVQQGESTTGQDRVRRFGDDASNRHNQFANLRAQRHPTTSPGKAMTQNIGGPDTLPSREEYRAMCRTRFEEACAEARRLHYLISEMDAADDLIPHSAASMTREQLAVNTDYNRRMDMFLGLEQLPWPPTQRSNSSPMSRSNLSRLEKLWREPNRPPPSELRRIWATPNTMAPNRAASAGNQLQTQYQSNYNDAQIAQSFQNAPFPSNVDQFGHERSRT